MSDTAGQEAWSYDEIGRVLTQKRTTNSVTQTFTYDYDEEGNLKFVRYPSGRQVDYSVNAAGRSIKARDNGLAVDYVNGTGSCASGGVCYAPQGSPASMKNGVRSGFAGYIRTWSYNKRLQPNTIVASSPTSTLFSLSYNFDSEPVAGVQNNGNVGTITNTLDGSRTQTFTYDELNRIKSGAAAWSQTYTYDIWGNLYNIVGTGGATGLSRTPNTKNQFVEESYDAAGNITLNPMGAGSITYNAENRATSAGGISYTYDGDGNRVKKSNGTLYWLGTDGSVLQETNLSGGLTNEFIYFNGQLVARRNASGATFYYFEDHLGSARINADANGVKCFEADYGPFGGEFTVITDTCGPKRKFTGQERDSETGLDYFISRHYASNLGRFLQSDPGDITERHQDNPQKWNRYSYTINNPLTFVDPNGEEEIRVTFRAFIPSQETSGPFVVAQGDDRNFSISRFASSRTSITVTVETDPTIQQNPLIGKPVVSVGESSFINILSSFKEQNATATIGLPTASVSRDKQGNVVIIFSQNTLFPGTPTMLTPGINAEVTTVIDPGATTAKAKGVVSNFPSFELNITKSNGKTIPVVQKNTCILDSLICLFGRRMTINVEKKLDGGNDQ